MDRVLVEAVINSRSAAWGTKFYILCLDVLDDLFPLISNPSHHSSPQHRILLPIIPKEKERDEHERNAKRRRW